MITVRPITVVVPARNESGTISKVVHECSKSKLIEQVIVVDNDSSDDTEVLARSVGAEVVKCERLGFGAALKAGFAAAKTDWVFKIDADIMNCQSDWIDKAWSAKNTGASLISIQWEHDKLYWALTYFLIRPFVEALAPALLRIPLLNSGMYLVDRSNIATQNFGDGWGFDTSMHLEAYLSGTPIEVCEIEPILDYLRPPAQYFKMASDTYEIFERFRQDPRRAEIAKTAKTY